MTAQPPGNLPPPPPGGYPPPPPPSGGGAQPPVGAAPGNNLILAILVTVFCCLPLGIVSIVKATQVSGLWASGQYIEAKKAAADAKKFALWGVIATVVVYAILLILYFAGVLVFLQTGDTNAY